MAELPGLASSFAARLLPEGRLTLAQSVPRYTQRLYDLVDWAGQQGLRAKVAELEETIYTDTRIDSSIGMKLIWPPDWKRGALPA